MLKIVLLAALREEYVCLKARTGPWQQIGRSPFIEFGRSFGDKQVVLVETGMGRERIEQSLAWTTSKTVPDVIVSFGFGGGLTEALPVGSVALGTDFLYLEKGCRDTPLQVRLTAPDGMLLDFCRDRNIPTVQIITVDRPRPKRPLSLSFSEVPAVMDMESYYVARFARQRGLPFLCFRAISDGLGDEIAFDLDDISSGGRVRVSKVLALVARKPGLMPSFYLSWRRSLKAARGLAEVLSALLDMPASQIRRIITECCSERFEQSP